MTNRYLHFKVFVVWVGIILLPATTWSQDSTGISQANRLYNQNQFREAAEIYERVIAGGMENGHLYYNLGNTYFRMGNLPRAILNYVKAQNLLPRNEDVEANLEYAVRQTVDQMDGRKPYALEAIFFWIGDLNLNEHRIILFGINLAFWIAMAVRLHHQTPATYTARNILLAFLVLALVSTGFRWHQDTHQSIGVILPQQIDVYSGWSPTTVVLFQLHQGTLVSISQEKENWYEIELSDQKKGWTLKSNIAG
ncbi:MAG: tetratricopeptide repeat protein [Nitrospinota bacterium]|nr:tetratricopeptide repeat protein [Nitrospinota bacterium]